jgi:hypothetical protein
MQERSTSRHDTVFYLFVEGIVTDTSKKGGLVSEWEERGSDKGDNIPWGVPGV